MDYHIYLSLFFLSVTFLLVHVFLQVTGNKNSHKIQKKTKRQKYFSPYFLIFFKTFEPLLSSLDCQQSGLGGFIH